MSWAEVKNLKDKMSDIANSTLHIEGGTDLAGQEVIIKRYDSDYMKATLDSTGSIEVEVTPKSKYRVTSNDADLSKRSQDIEVGTGDLVNVELSYRKYIGKDVLPVDDVPTWLACHPTAGSYKYTTMEQVLKDSTCLIALLSNQNSLDYLMRSRILFEQLAGNKSAALQFSSMTMCNNALRDTPAMIPIATASAYCEEMFPWQFPRAVTGGANSAQLADGLTAITSSVFDASYGISNTFAKAPAALDSLPYTIWVSAGAYNILVDRSDATKPYTYKFLPKCIIITAHGSNFSSPQTYSVVGKRYDEYAESGKESWDTLASVTIDTKGVRKCIDIADNQTEYIAFKITAQGASTYTGISNVQALGYRYAYNDRREPV